MHKYRSSTDQLKLEQLPSTGRSSYRSNNSNTTPTQAQHIPKIPNQQLLSHINPFNRSKYKQKQQIILRNTIENKEKDKEKEKDKQQQSSQQKINRIASNLLKKQSQKQNCSQCWRNGCIQEKNYEGKEKSLYRNLFNLRLENLEGLRGQYAGEKIRESWATKMNKHNYQHDHHKPQDCHHYNSTFQKKLLDLQTRLTQTQSKLHNFHLHTLQPHFNPKTHPHHYPHPYLEYIQQPSNYSLKLLKNIAQIKDIYTLIRDHKIIQSQINQKISKEINCIFDSLPKIKDDVQRQVILMMNKWREDDVRARGEQKQKQKQQNEEKKQVKICKEGFIIEQWAKKLNSDLEQKINSQLHSMEQKIANLDKKFISQTPIKIIPTHPKPFSAKSIKITPPTPSSAPITNLKLTQELHPYSSTRQPSQPSQPPQPPQPPKTLHLQLPQQKNDNQPSCSLILSPLSSPSSSSPTPTPIFKYKHTYYIDNNGYLLDESMFYILDQNDKPIKILDQQFDMLKNLCYKGSEKNIEKGNDKQNMGANDGNGGGNGNGNGNEVNGQKCGVMRFR